MTRIVAALAVAAFIVDRADLDDQPKRPARRGWPWPPDTAA